ncbi:hypothetical protein D1007_20699 [Hordeum vulgare]|nr:hypothetical protein D1007_20699 [Hordeum vulgare]
MVWAVGVQQRLLLANVQRDGHAGDELLLHALVLIEDAKVVLMVGMCLPERSLPLCQHHASVVRTSLTHGDSGMGRRSWWCWLVSVHLFHWNIRGVNLW